MTFSTWLLVSALMLLGFALRGIYKDVFICARCCTVKDAAGRPIPYAWSTVHEEYVSVCETCYVEIRGQDETEVDVDG